MKNQETKLSENQQNVINKLTSGSVLTEIEGVVMNRGSKWFKFDDNSTVHHMIIRSLMKQKLIKKDVSSKIRTIGGYSTKLILA